MNPIALGIQPIRLDNPLEQATRAMSLKQMMQQSRAFDDKKAEDEAVKGAIASSGGDLELAARNLTMKGHVNPALAIRKSLMEERKAGLDTSKLKSELQSKFAGAFLSLPPDQKAAQYPQFVQMWNEAGLWGPQGPGTVPNVPWDERFAQGLSMFANQGLSAKESLAESQSYPSQPTTMQNITSGPTPITPEDVEMSPQEFGKFHVPPGAQSMNDVVPYLSRDQELAAAEGRVQASKGADGKLFLASPQVIAERQAALQTGQINAPGVENPAQAPVMTAEGLRKQAKELEALGGSARLERAHKLRQDANAMVGRELELQRLEQSKAANEETRKNREAQQGNETRKNTLQLSEDFRQEPAVKAYRTVAPLTAVMQEAVARNTAGADVNLVYIVSKVFDPDSVVRDQERATVINAGGLPAYVQSALGYVIGGQRIPDDIRNQLLQEVQSRFGAYKQSYDQISSQYKDTASRFGVDHRDIVRHVEVKPESPIKTIGTDRRKQGKSPAAPAPKAKYPTDFSDLWNN